MCSGGLAWGAFGTNSRAAADTPAEEASEAPTAPALFADGLPVAIEKTPDGLPSISAQGCNACHFQAHDDWARSAHATAWKKDTIQAAAARAGGSTACTQCHLPLANQHAELAAGYIDGDFSRPQLVANKLWDPTLMSEGVTCAACHVRDGTIISTRPISGAPHPVAVSSELGTSEACATCHQLTWAGADKPFYDTVREWEGSPQGKAGLRCQDCHMPPKAGLATASRFAASPDHGLTADIRRALSVFVELEASRIERGAPFPVGIRIQNTGAGHHVPTGSPYKIYSVIVELIGADGTLLAPAFTHELERKVAEAPPYETLSDNRIAAGGEMSLSTTFTVDHRKPAGTAFLRVRIGREEKENPAPTLQEIRIPVF